MSDFETVARPYSRAIFELASEQGNLPLWSEVLQLAAIVASDEGLQSVISSPSILASEISDLFISIMSGAQNAPEITAEVKNMIALLAENERLLALPNISSGFETLKQEAEGSVEVQVTSAQALTAEQEQQMTQNLKKKLGKEVSISAEVDESLIAGAIIKAGDLVIDGTALGRLNKLTSLLNK